MAVRTEIKNYIDANIQNFVGAKDPQSMDFPYRLNSDELAYLITQIRLARASDVSDDYSRTQVRFDEEDVDAGHPLPVTDAGGGVVLAAIQALLTQIENNTDDLELSVDNIDLSNTQIELNTDQIEALIALTNAVLATIDADTANIALDTSSMDGNIADILTSAQTIDDIIGTEDTAVPSKTAQVGGEARDTVATELDNGDLASFLFTLFKELIIAGYNWTTQSLDTTDINPAKMAFEYLIDEQLTAAGSTAEVNVELYDIHTVQLLVASINDSVTMRVEGSLDGTNWFNVDNESDPEGVDTTYSSDGTYFIPVREMGPTKLKKLRATMVDEEGGTDVTVDVLSMHGN